MDLELLEQTLARHAQPRFRARQVWAWAARGAASYEQMTDLPAWLRRALARLPRATRPERSRCLPPRDSAYGSAI